MSLTYLQKLYEQGLVAFHESFPSWQDAVLAAVEPMVKKDMVLPEYGSSILKHVQTYGPYIFLAPHICMPHCNAYEYVRTPGVCFMKCNQPVIADPAEPDMGAELFFTVAAQAEGEHLDAVKELMHVLEDEALIDALLGVTSEAAFRELLNSCGTK